jgi:hypothetical protein
MSKERGYIAKTPNPLSATKLRERPAGPHGGGKRAERRRDRQRTRNHLRFADDGR